MLDRPVTIRCDACTMEMTTANYNLINAEASHGVLHNSSMACTGRWRLHAIPPESPPPPAPGAAPERGGRAARLTREERLRDGWQERWGLWSSASGWDQAMVGRRSWRSEKQARAFAGGPSEFLPKRYWYRKKPAPPPATTTVPVDRENDTAFHQARREEMDGAFAAIDATELRESLALIRSLRADLAGRDATIRELTAERDALRSVWREDGSELIRVNQVEHYSNGLCLARLPPASPTSDVKVLVLARHFIQQPRPAVTSSDSLAAAPVPEQPARTDAPPPSRAGMCGATANVQFCELIAGHPGHHVFRQQHEGYHI